MHFHMHKILGHAIQPTAAQEHISLSQRCAEISLFPRAENTHIPHAPAKRGCLQSGLFPYSETPSGSSATRYTDLTVIFLDKDRLDRYLYGLGNFAPSWSQT